MKKAIPPSARTAEGGILSIKKGMYMNTLHIPEKKIPVIDTFDTVVLGGGTAGAFRASLQLAAAAVHSSSSSSARSAAQLPPVLCCR